MPLINRILQWNPLAGRFAFNQLRPRNLGISVGIYTCTMIVIILLNIPVPSRDNPLSLHEIAEPAFGWLVALQVLMLWVVGIYNSGSIVRDEIQDKSIDFFRLLPITPHARILGILVGRNLVIIILGIINGLLLTGVGLAAGMPLYLLLEIGALILAGTFALMLSALITSTVEIRNRKNTSHVGLLVLCVFLLPYLFALASMWRQFFPNDLYGSWFGVKIQLLPLITLVTLYFTAWLYACLAHRFRYEREPFFTTRGAVGFMAGFVLLTVGLFWSHLTPEAHEILVILWFLLALPLILLPLGVSRSFQDYAEQMAVVREPLRLFSRHSNLASGWINLAIWLVMALFLHPSGLVRTPWHALVMTSFWLVLVLIIEATVVCIPLTDRVKHLAGFLTSLYLFLTPLFALISGDPNLAVFSPLGYLGRIIAPKQDPLLELSPYILFMNAFLIILLGMVINERYLTLSKSHQPGSSERPS